MGDHAGGRFDLPRGADAGRAEVLESRAGRINRRPDGVDHCLDHRLGPSERGRDAGRTHHLPGPDHRDLNLGPPEVHPRGHDRHARPPLSPPPGPVECTPCRSPPSSWCWSPRRSTPDGTSPCTASRTVGPPWPWPASPRPCSSSPSPCSTRRGRWWGSPSCQASSRPPTPGSSQRRTTEARCRSPTRSAEAPRRCWPRWAAGHCSSSAPGSPGWPAPPCWERASSSYGLAGRQAGTADAVAFAVLVGVTIAAYSVVDSKAVRDASPLAYLAPVFAIEGALMAASVRFDASRLRRSLRPAVLVIAVAASSPTRSSCSPSGWPTPDG